MKIAVFEVIFMKRMMENLPSLVTSTTVMRNLLRLKVFRSTSIMIIPTFRIWLKQLHLNILNPPKVKKALVKSIRVWTEKQLYAKYNRKLQSESFDAYFGIGLAISSTHFNSIKDYWSKKKFLGSQDISSVMSRNTSCHTRLCLWFYPDEVNISVKRHDQLCHSRNILNHFLQNVVSIAIPDGPVAFDENTIRTKARTQAKSCIPSKPVKFGIRFYYVVGWKYAYLYLLWDNVSGNRTGLMAQIHRRHQTFQKNVIKEVQPIHKFQNFLLQQPKKISYADFGDATSLKALVNIQSLLYASMLIK